MTKLTYIPVFLYGELWKLADVKTGTFLRGSDGKSMTFSSDTAALEHIKKMESEK